MKVREISKSLKSPGYVSALFFILQRPFLVLENIFVAPVAFLMPQLFVMLADKFDNPSLTYCPAIFGGLINVTIIFMIYRKDKQKV